MTFRQTIASYLEDHKAAKPGVPVSLLFFMQVWLKQHVLKTEAVQRVSERARRALTRSRLRRG